MTPSSPSSSSGGGIPRGGGDIWAEGTPRAAERLGLDPRRRRPHKFGYGPHWGRAVPAIRPLFRSGWFPLFRGPRREDPYNQQHGYGGALSPLCQGVAAAPQEVAAKRGCDTVMPRSARPAPSSTAPSTPMRVGQAGVGLRRARVRSRLVARHRAIFKSSAAGLRQAVPLDL